MVSLSPLEKWLKTIEQDLADGNILKARFSALVLPFFEVMQIREVFFEEYRKSEISFSQLISKTSILVFNIFFIPYYGFKHPDRLYAFHQHCGILIRPVLPAEDILSPSLLRETEEPLQLPEPEIEDPVEHSVEDVIHVDEVKKEASESKIQGLIKHFQQAPRMQEKRTTFHHTIRNASNRHRSFSSRKSCTIPDKNPLGDFLAEKETTKENKSLPIHQPRKESSSNLDDEEFNTVRPLIKTTISQDGSWKVVNNKISYAAGKKFHFEPAIIDLLAQANAKGLFAKLTLDQTYILRQNLEIISSCFETFKHHQLDKFVDLIQTVKDQMVALWVQEDHQEHTLLDKLDQLTTNILQLLKKGEGGSTKNRLRLFEESDAADLIHSIEQWQLSLVSSKISKLTLFDFNEILKAYLQVLPDSIKKGYEPLRQAKNPKEWSQALSRLPSQENALATKLLLILQEASQSIWKNNPKEMLSFTPPINDLIFPSNRDTMIEILSL